MTLQMMRCFCAVADTLSFSKAAEQLCITQPAVSHQVQELEKELDVRLLDRSLRSVSLTPAGISFYGDAKDILERTALAVENVRQSAHFEETIHVGCQSTLQLRLLPKIYKAYSAMDPDVYINTKELSVTRQGIAVEGHLDIAFLTGDCAAIPKNLTYTPLYKGHFCCVMPCGHRLCNKEIIGFDDLAHETLVLLDTALCPPDMEQVQTEIRKNCTQSRFYRSTSSLYTSLMIEGGLGIAVMPDFVCPDSAGIASVPFETEHTPEYGIAVRKGRQPKRIQQFVQAACAEYAEEKLTNA